MFSPHSVTLPAPQLSLLTQKTLYLYGTRAGELQPPQSGCQSQTRIKKGSVVFRKLHGDQQINELLP